MPWPTSRSTSSCCSTPPTLSSIFTTLIAGPSFANGVMPPSIPARPPPRTSKAFSSTAHRVCARCRCCRLRGRPTFDLNPGRPYMSQPPSRQPLITTNKAAQNARVKAILNQTALEGHQSIADLMTGWIHRDLAEWDQLRELFHPDGTIEISWFEGLASDFVDGSMRMGKSDLRTKHF